MDPLLDEKIILSISRILPDIFHNTLEIQAVREAYGPSRNAGLCYEKCSAIDLKGDFDGRYYMGLDGYTKTRLMPYIAESFSLKDFSQISSSQIFMEFINLICGHISNELNSAGFTLDIGLPMHLDNRLVKINLQRYRQYIIIYFLQDPVRNKYLGRAYAILTLKKFDQLATRRLLDLPPIQPDWEITPGTS